MKKVYTLILFNLLYPIFLTVLFGSNYIATDSFKLNPISITTLVLFSLLFIWTDYKLLKQKPKKEQGEVTA